MAANPRMVTQAIQVAWDGGLVNVPAGTIVDIPAGSALEAAYGLANLAPLTSQETGGSADVEPIEVDPVT
jgi:hypothetical protein